MERKAAKGEWAGGTRPYGYLVDPATSRLVPHPVEAPVLTDIFRLYTTNRAGTRAIAATLNQRGVPNRTGRPWSGYTIARILANRAYLGEINYRDLTVPGAHPPLADQARFDEAQRIMTARGEACSQRAASTSDYHLTGLINCPNCGRRYVGTSATGRNRSYRYYTCFSRSRYGPTGCTSARLDADATDKAVIKSLIDFYSHTNLITAAVEAAQREHAGNRDAHRAELAALDKQITNANAAIDRYLTAFENGTLDDQTCGQRVRNLHTRLHQLQARRAEISDHASTEPAPPTATELADIRDLLAHVFAHGTPGQRKAVIETHIAEIRIQGDKIIPVFKLPNPGTSDAPTNTSRVEDIPVRTMVRSVGVTSAEPKLSHGGERHRDRLARQEWLVGPREPLGGPKHVGTEDTRVGDDRAAIPC